MHVLRPALVALPAAGTALSRGTPDGLAAQVGAAAASRSQKVEPDFPGCWIKPE